ncbi:GNAT family N-acetyltransferase [Taibaiella koreensis]|uniref:GNAT family N-acetyltransferase n=1 Tax=Taibaiella koreensis TaxID=1268548 RepID=UPI000E5A0402|nr:GNAT family N-acetyltransferase [Taibaiella koreensis]
MHSVYIITTEHSLYNQVIDLRQRVLRAPLGLDIRNDDLAAEQEQIIFVYEEDHEVKGCVLLQQYDAETFKLRQMAVDATLQGKGVGTQLINAADLYAVQVGKHRILLHARETAVPFYQRLGYEVTGDPFTEIGLPHRTMEKLLV